jgi:dipeptidyl aminopeptidase/acylaminoacyl peptidase
MAQPLALNEVLSLKYIRSWSWSPVAPVIAFIWDDGGVHDLWIVNGDGSVPPRRLTQAQSGVSAFDWHPRSGALAFVQDGHLWIARPAADWYELGRATGAGSAGSPEQAPYWDPSGERIAFLRDDRIRIRHVRSGVEQEIPLDGPVYSNILGPSPWSPDGSHLVCRFMDSDRRLQAVVLDRNGDLLWRTDHDGGMAGRPLWLDNESITFSLTREMNTVRDFYTAAFDFGARGTEQVRQAGQAGRPCRIDQVDKAGRADELAGARYRSRVPVEVAHIHRQEYEPVRGHIWVTGSYPSPDGQRILFMLENDGWAHFHMFDRKTAGMEQVTFGECEDYGHEGDRPEWSPDEKHVVYSSNRAASGQRHLWLLNVESKRSDRLTRGEAADVQPRWSRDGKRIAFIHCDPWRSPDLWSVGVVGPGAGGGEGSRCGESSCGRESARGGAAIPAPVQLTTSMPATWTPEKGVLPAEVVFKSSDGLDIHGFLLRPPGLPADSRCPALVWVHGGPANQMLGGWHPGRAYALFHAFSQYLAHRGYVTLAVNFRGGSGYGRHFRDAIYHSMGVGDVADVVAAGRYLKCLPFVDGNRVAVWGISYGGYLTLHAMTQYPDEFRMGVNIAGIWDMVQLTRWLDRSWSPYGESYKSYLGGEPEDSLNLYRQASPCTFKQKLSRPLINLQGTADASVDFGQMDRIIKDCVDLGRQYEAYYHPGEDHVFRHRSTWADAFKRIERDLERYMGGFAGV